MFIFLILLYTSLRYGSYWVFNNPGLLYFGSKNNLSLATSGVCSIGIPDGNILPWTFPSESKSNLGVKYDLKPKSNKFLIKSLSSYEIPSVLKNFSLFKKVWYTSIFVSSGVSAFISAIVQALTLGSTKEELIYVKTSFYVFRKSSVETLEIV